MREIENIRPILTFLGRAGRVIAEVRFAGIGGGYPYIVYDYRQARNTPRVCLATPDQMFAFSRRLRREARSVRAWDIGTEFLQEIERRMPRASGPGRRNRAVRY